MDKCENCEKEGQSMIDINNYSFSVETVISFNCCCKECAEDKLRKEGYEDFEDYLY